MNPHEQLEVLRHADAPLALRRILERSVRPGMRVLDAGCGVGVAALWAARAGAQVVAVDLGQTQLARRLAEANRVADHVRWVRGDLARLQRDDLGAQFDLIVAPRCEGDLRHDEGVMRLIAQLVERFLAPGGRLLPDCITTRACALEWNEQDLPSRLREVRTEIEALRGRFGLAFEPLLEDLGRPPNPRWFPERRDDGRLARDGARLLGRAEELHRLEAGRGFEPLPKSARVQIASPGTLTGVLFTQSLSFGDDVFAEHESLAWVAEPLRVEPGERVSFALDARWRETNALGLALHEQNAG
ncbi:MAG TPA: methyltransferase domain-containing protein [Myxococcota bacterium]|nr:methyltransferase domain-containing protein [Myxococcota bacterium]